MNHSWGNVDADRERKSARYLLTVLAEVASDRPLTYELRLSALDRLLGGDPLCDVVIHTPEDALDPLMTVIEVGSRGSLDA